MLLEYQRLKIALTSVPMREAESKLRFLKAMNDITRNTILSLIFRGRARDEQHPYFKTCLPRLPAIPTLE